MENNALNTQSMSSTRVVLELLGIDKKWVKGKNGQWMDEQEALSQIEVSSTHSSDDLDSPRKRKFWEFWKK